MLGKVKAMISALRRDVINNIDIKGFHVKLEGNGVSDPVATSGYNFLSATRTGTGVYEVTVQQATIYGFSLLDDGFLTKFETITSNPDTDVNVVNYTVTSSTTLDIEVFEVVQGTGNRLDIVPYDIESGDFISLTISVNAGTGELPPE